MIVKMIILRLSGSSDDKEKEKIGVARPEGPPLRGFRYPVPLSDDDSDSPSIDELLDLVHEHQKVIKKQSKEIKNLSALKDINASLATNFEDLMCKFNLLSKEHEECDTPAYR